MARHEGPVLLRPVIRRMPLVRHTHRRARYLERVRVPEIDVLDLELAEDDRRYQGRHRQGR